MSRKTALVTGASRGIGAAIARKLAEEGCDVAVNYNRSREQAEALACEFQSLGVRALTVKADVGSSEEVLQMVNKVWNEFCQLDILVCNAGVAWQGLFQDMTDEDWHRLMAVDLDGVFYCCREAAKRMIPRQTGSIVTVSSMWGVAGGACEAAYSAAKAGVIGLTKALAKELGPSGIRVNCVAPGVIDTEMNRNLGPEALEALKDETPLERLGSGRDVAEAVAFLALERGSFFTGQVLQPNGGLII